jgi:pimeloyl-ACP methyl ester carboxylesterase
MYIHGIIGETKLMASSGRTDWLKLENSVSGLNENHDLLLAFDYENINTPIEDVALQLKEKLAAIGLQADHEKTFNIIAHSMGGLVSRWFIEHLGGNKVVNHLVMLGTPNGGSPLPQIEDWLLGALTLGLNGLAVAAWPVSLLNGIIAAIEKIDVSLDQMHPASDFLKHLSRSQDPEIPYTIIAGNTSLPAAVIGGKDEGEGQSGLLPTIWSKGIKHELMDYAFLGDPNDIAVSVESIKELPKDWAVTVAKVHEIQSDHMSYFLLEDG